MLMGLCPTWYQCGIACRLMLSEPALAHPPRETLLTSNTDRDLIDSFPYAQGAAIVSLGAIGGHRRQGSISTVR
jgi:hypothetical protein